MKRNKHFELLRKVNSDLLDTGKTNRQIMDMSCAGLKARTVDKIMS